MKLIFCNICQKEKPTTEMVRCNDSFKKLCKECKRTKNKIKYNANKEVAKKMIDANELLLCYGCKIKKSSSHFKISSLAHNDYFCKDCVSKRCAEYYENNK